MPAIRILVLVAGIGLAGTVSLGAPGWRWAALVALGAGLLLAIRLIWRAEASIRAYRDARRDAQRRNRWAR